jgi:hypothetical protein
MCVTSFPSNVFTRIYLSRRVCRGWMCVTSFPSNVFTRIYLSRTRWWQLGCGRSYTVRVQEPRDRARVREEALARRKLLHRPPVPDLRQPEIVGCRTLRVVSWRGHWCVFRNHMIQVQTVQPATLPSHCLSRDDPSADSATGHASISLSLS